MAAGDGSIARGRLHTT